MEETKMALSRGKLLEDLSSKTNQEYEDWKSGLVLLPPVEIFERAYEIVTIGEIKNVLDDVSYNAVSADLRTLLRLDNVFLEIYEEWLNCIVSIADDLKDAINDTIRKAIEREKLAQKQIKGGGMNKMVAVHQGRRSRINSGIKMD
jgi:hypothetical protein